MMMTADTQRANKLRTVPHRIRNRTARSLSRKVTGIFLTRVGPSAMLMMSSDLGAAMIPTTGVKAQWNSPVHLLLNRKKRLHPTESTPIFPVQYKRGVTSTHMNCKTHSLSGSLRFTIKTRCFTAPYKALLQICVPIDTTRFRSLLRAGQRQSATVRAAWEKHCKNLCLPYRLYSHPTAMLLNFLHSQGLIRANAAIHHQPLPSKCWPSLQHKETNKVPAEITASETSRLKVFGPPVPPGALTENRKTIVPMSMPHTIKYPPEVPSDSNMYDEPTTTSPIVALPHDPGSDCLWEDKSLHQGDLLQGCNGMGDLSVVQELFALPVADINSSHCSTSPPPRATSVDETSESSHQSGYGHSSSSDCVSTPTLESSSHTSTPSEEANTHEAPSHAANFGRTRSIVRPSPERQELITVKPVASAVLQPNATAIPPLTAYASSYALYITDNLEATWQNFSDSQQARQETSVLQR